MSQKIAYSEVSLTPNEITGSRTPFVSPVFLENFRTIERLCWEGEHLANEVRKMALSEWTENDIEPGIRLLENWLALQFLNAELTQACKDFDSRMGQMSSPLDPRYSHCDDAADGSCMNAWLAVGRRLNIIKGRSLLQAAPASLKSFAGALEDTAEEAAKVSAVVTRMAAKAIHGSTSYVLERTLLETA